MSAVDAAAIMQFLAERIAGNAGDKGVSSDALIAAAVLGRTPPHGTYPRDLGDLGRCYEAFHHAPYSLKRRMLPILAGWTYDLESKERERAA